MSRWAGCYDGNWNGLIADEAFAHPAKFANGLINRIFDHLALPKGSIVVDPFGGVGLGGVVAASRGLQWFGCELEEKFCNLARQNFELHRRMWEQHGDPLPVIVQGDSRQLRANLAGIMADVVVSSPPFHDQQPLKGGEKLLAKISDKYGNNKQRRSGSEQPGYGSTPGNIANLPSGSVDAVVSSPPYEGSVGTPSVGAIQGQGGWGDGGDIAARSENCFRAQYGQSDGQLGHTTGDTFWAAAADIVAECFAILRPGGVAAWVCKDFVRKGARVPFSNDWRKLCESQGFLTVEWIHASLVKEDSHPSLFDDQPIVKRTERKSFFRRLAEKKGSPPIDHEDVLVMRKPDKAVPPASWAG